MPNARAGRGWWRRVVGMRRHGGRVEMKQLSSSDEVRDQVAAIRAREARG